MDLNLSLGLPRCRRRRRGLDLRSVLSLVSPPPPAPSSPPAPLSSSVVDFHAAATEMSQPLGGAYTPYSPTRPLFADSLDLRPPVAGGGGDAPDSEYSPLSPSYQSNSPRDPVSPTGPPPEEPLFRGGVAADGDPSHAPYTPPYVPLSAMPVDLADGSTPVVSNLGGEDRVPPFGDLSDSEFQHIPTVIEQWWRTMREFESAMSLSRATIQQFLHELPASSGRGEDPAENGNGGGAVGVFGEGLEEEEEEEEKQCGVAGTVDFECNICLEVAKEPVVTRCGHLFCWPCLYRWLHLCYSHRECPVCKGEVDDSNITPIYGRGSLGTATQDRDRDAVESGLKIPPRPRGQRVEGWRQRILRPTSRRFRGGGISGPWSLIGEQLWNRNQWVADWVPNPQENVGSAHQRSFTRLRARRSALVMDYPEDATETASNANENRVGTSSGNQDRIVWDQLQFNSSDRSRRLAAFTARISRMFGGSVNGSNSAGTSASSASPQNPDDPVVWTPSGSSQAVDQLSASSTLAVIQEDAEASDVGAGPDSAGSSSSLGRRGRNALSGSLDVDGCLLHACKRRRLN